MAPLHTGATHPRTATVPPLVHLLRKFALAYVDAMAALAVEAGLHQTDLRALIELLDAAREDRRLGAGDLGRALGMTTQATTALIKRLEGEGLVTRRRNRSDARRVELLVSPHALDIGWHHFGQLVEVLSEAVVGLDDADHTTIERSLNHALRGLNALAGPPVTCPSPITWPPEQ